MNAVKNFLHYFFGQGETEEFTNFTFAHLAPILVAVGIIFLIYRFREQLQNCKHEAYFRYAIAFTMIVSEMAYYWRLVGMSEMLDPNPVDHLPIAVCGWVAIFGSYMMAGKSQSLFDIIYFWIFSGTVFALLTPTVITFTGPTRFRYYQFWVEHLIGYIGVFYMIFVHKMRPTVKSAIKSYAWFGVLATIAFFTNRLIGPGANYLFMAKPEDTPSILDILPPNFILRLLVMASAVTVLYFVAYLPWFLKDRKAKKAEAAEEQVQEQETVQV